ncbi:hypothetical protein BDZ85DRAFT_93614 [Elsinoe ampelina]|uniref:DUF6594 domain-containing protein n=1 Tax=Elsinoe ampelina TaxID=302913 RepID=A0A6A6FYX2_9PEZI|nr:hypothetical protein BDZ85DRAFT_93614 [Elsinoe ampelina]
MSSPQAYSQGHCEYSKFLSLVASFANFPRYADLSVRNLVHLSAQLQALEKELEIFDIGEKELIQKASTGERLDIQNANRSWACFEQLATVDESGANRWYLKLRLAKRIEEVMDRYQRALINHSALMQLPFPKQHIFDTAAAWAEQREPAYDFQMMFKDRSQFVSLHRGGSEDDLLSRIVHAMFGWCFREKREKRQLPEEWPPLQFYNDQATRVVTSIILRRACSVRRGHAKMRYARSSTQDVSSMAFILLFGATAILTLVTNLSKADRMVMIGCFTMTFAILVGIFTNCKRSELFVAVATYSAVLVVFAEVTKD